jgi:hypothetical protein
VAKRHLWRLAVFICIKCWIVALLELSGREEDIENKYDDFRLSIIRGRDSPVTPSLCPLSPIITLTGGRSQRQLGPQGVRTGITMQPRILAGLINTSERSAPVRVSCLKITRPPILNFFSTFNSQAARAQRLLRSFCGSLFSHTWETCEIARGQTFPAGFFSLPWRSSSFQSLPTFYSSLPAPFTSPTRTGLALCSSASTASPQSRYGPLTYPHPTPPLAWPRALINVV